MKSNARTWVLLRGLAREKGHWGPFADQFRERFHDDEVLLLDLPGAGEFRDIASPRDLHGIYRFVREKAVERARAQAQFSLVALSLGGMVALEWMRQKPDDLQACVLINSSSKAVSPLFHRLRWQIWGRFLSLIAITSPRDREKAIAGLIMNSESAREKALPLWYRLAVEHPMSYLNFTNQLLAASRFKDLPAGCDIPVLLLCGLGDRLVDPSCSFALSAKMGWPLERHPWGGHDLPWDDGEWVINRIQAWSEQVSDSTRGSSKDLKDLSEAKHQ